MPLGRVASYEETRSLPVEFHRTRTLYSFGHYRSGQSLIIVYNHQGCELYAEWPGAVPALTLRMNRMTL